MIRFCAKYITTVPCHSGSPVCLSRLFPMSTANNSVQRRYFASERKESSKTFKKVFYTTVGITLIGVGGIVVYAKSDPRFRKVLESYVPGSDKFISIVYQEDGSVSVGTITEQLGTIQEKIMSVPSDIYKLISSSDDSKPAPPLVKELKQTESRKLEPKATVDLSKKTPAVVNVSYKEDLNKIFDAHDFCKKKYDAVLTKLDGVAKEIIELIEQSVDGADPKKWSEVKKQLDEKRNLWNELNNLAEEARSHADSAARLYKKHFNDMSLEERDQVHEKKSKCEASVNEMERFKHSRLGAAAKYLDRIEASRKQLSDELRVLFPSVRLDDKSLQLKEDELDLFLCYAAQKLLYYKKELIKLETLTSDRLKKSLHDSSDPEKLQETVNLEIDKAKRELREEFDKKAQELKLDCDKEAHNQLKRQEQVHMDIMSEQLALKEKEVERKLIQHVEQKVEEERYRLQAELADMAGRMQGLNEAIAKRALQDQKAQTSQALWFAAEALYASLKSCYCDDTSSFSPKPLSNLVDAIKNASAKGDDVVEVVVSTIPSKALSRGVYPEDVLRERFLRVEDVAWKVAGIPEGKTTLVRLAFSRLCGYVIIKTIKHIPNEEINNGPINPFKLTNYDVLQRAKYFVERSDFEQALKYMNLLRGSARSVASDWMKEVTMYLETRQAACLLLAHASASGMIYS